MNYHLADGDLLTIYHLADDDLNHLAYDTSWWPITLQMMTLNICIWCFLMTYHLADDDLKHLHMMLLDDLSPCRWWPLSPCIWCVLMTYSIILQIMTSLTLLMLTCFPVRMIPSLLVDVDLPDSADNYCISYYERNIVFKMFVIWTVDAALTTVPAWALEDPPSSLILCHCRWWLWCPILYWKIFYVDKMHDLPRLTDDNL